MGEPTSRIRFGSWKVELEGKGESNVKEWDPSARKRLGFEKYWTGFMLSKERSPRFLGVQASSLTKPFYIFLLIIGSLLKDEGGE